MSGGDIMLSILNLNPPAGVIPDQVFSDVALDKLISRGETAVLSRICTPADILARQEVFRLLEDKGFYDWFQGLYLNLKYLDKARYMFEHAVNEVEQSVLFLEYADTYIKSLDSMENALETPLLRVLNDEVKTCAGEKEALKSSITEYAELLKSISKIRVTISADGTYFKRCTDDEPSISETIYRIADSLGYGSELEAQKLSFKMSYQMSMAIIETYSQEFRKMAELRKIMLPAINTDILSLVGDIDFYLSINRLRKRAAEQFKSYYPNESVIAADFCIDSDGKISGLSMISESKYLPEQKSGKKRGFSLFGKSDTNESPNGIRVGLTSEDRGGIISKTAKEITEAFEYIITSVCGEFSGIYYDLAFYVFAVKYCEAMVRAGTPVCFAELSDSTEITGLYDVYLLLTLPNPSAVVQNDFLLSYKTKGIIITGDNSAGKTVYLRAVSMAYILTAAGLPISAESAKISLPKDISLQMASAERAYQSGNITGRFEEEVIDIKKIVDSVQTDSIILLNEVFQTTDYSEGAEGLYYILEYLNKKGARWILVTHLKQLTTMYKNDLSVVKLRAGSGERYKVCRDGDNG